MNQIILLRKRLKPLLGWHGARLSFLALFLIALLRVKTINLVELATGFRSPAKTDSNYKRLQRFFKDFNLDYAAIARVIVTKHGDSSTLGSQYRQNRMVIRSNSLQYSDASCSRRRGCLSIVVGNA